MTGIGGDRADRPLVAVQPEIEGALLLPPEALVEFVIEAGCPLPHLLGPLRLPPDLKGLRHPQQGIEGIPLQLAERMGERRDAAVLVANGVVRVLPTLTVEAARRARLVLLKAVAVAVAVLEHPLERRLRVRSVAVEDLLVARPLERVREDDQEEQRRIRRSKVGSEGQQTEAGQLAVAQLVRDLAWLLVLLRVIIGRLHAREPVERTEGELRKPADALHRDDESVATEQGDVPGDAGGWDENATPDGEVRHPERFHIGDGLAPDDGKGRVARFDVGRWRLAGRHPRPPGAHADAGT